jgi:hypothetical protein
MGFEHYQLIWAPRVMVAPRQTPSAESAIGNGPSAMPTADSRYP